MSTASNDAAAHVARDAYSRLVALAAHRTGDVAAAEDALSDAFLAALEQWPGQGIPHHPQAWILSVARRRHIDMMRRQVVRRQAVQHDATTVLEWLQQQNPEAASDHRLGLLFACAHPSIDPQIRAPLMLQTVLGVSAQQIGQAFLVSAKTMGQRLSRAKNKIKQARIPFDSSFDSLELERFGIVCEAIYGAFATGYNEESPSFRSGLVDEALWLGHLVHRLAGEHPESAGLLSLMLHIEARRSARRDQHGNYVPLERQETARWDHAMIALAEEHLWRAGRAQQTGRFQLEAAIQSAHAHRAITGRTDWVAIEVLYRRLLEYADTVGARVAHLAAYSEVFGAKEAYERLIALVSERSHQSSIDNHQAYWALRAHLEKALGLSATRSLERAVLLTEDPAVRAFLLASATT